MSGSSPRFEWLFFTLVVPNDGIQRQISRKFDCGSAELLDGDTFPGRVRFRLYRPIDNMTRGSLERDLAKVVPKGTVVAWVGERVVRESAEVSSVL